jgi:acyl carrier protein
MAPARPEPQELSRIVREVIFDTLQKKKSRFKLEDIKEGVSLTKDLGIDSLDILQMTAVCEKRFNLRIPDAENQNLDELGGIVKVLAKCWPKP